MREGRLNTARAGAAPQAVNSTIHSSTRRSQCHGLRKRARDAQAGRLFIYSRTTTRRLVSRAHHPTRNGGAAPAPRPGLVSFRSVSLPRSLSAQRAELFFFVSVIIVFKQRPVVIFCWTASPHAHSRTISSFEAPNTATTTTTTISSYRRTLKYYSPHKPRRPGRA